MVVKYEIGDTVRCLRDHIPVQGGQQCFHKGGEYEVGGIWYTTLNTNHVGIVADDQGRNNGWDRSFFERANGPW